MQHYSVPTRLLDWSESLLPALYFAVRDDHDEDGELFVLNAKRLNGMTKPRHTISTPSNSHVIIQSEMAVTRSAKTLRRKESVIKALAAAGGVSPTKQSNAWLNAYRRPIAVFPSRLYERMVFQASVFTLHGGKEYVKDMESRYRGEIIPKPIHLESMNEASKKDTPILQRYSIPRRAKAPILKDLLILGIHEGTLFPEVDRQAVYLTKQWWYPDKP
jgi:hypothetical protein